MIDKKQYGLDDKINLYDGTEIMVFCAESKTAFKKWVVMTDYDTTFRELLKEARVPISNGNVAYIIFEFLLDGVIYQFGNYDLKNVYKHGETRGYA
jgi:hypothetical protein